MGRGLPILAVRLGQDPYGFIGKFQAFNGFGKTPAALATELFNALRKNKQSQGKMADAVLGLLEKSASFDAAKVRTGYLEELESWHPSFTDRIRSALRTNGQIAHSWGVPERLEALIAKWDPAAVIDPVDEDNPF